MIPVIWHPRIGKITLTLIKVRVVVTYGGIVLPGMGNKGTSGVTAINVFYISLGGSYVDLDIYRNWWSCTLKICIFYWIQIITKKKKERKKPSWECTKMFNFILQLKQLKLREVMWFVLSRCFVTGLPDDRIVVSSSVCRIQPLRGPQGDHSQYQHRSQWDCSPNRNLAC